MWFISRNLNHSRKRDSTVTNWKRCQRVLSYITPKLEKKGLQKKKFFWYRFLPQNMKKDKMHCQDIKIIKIYCKRAMFLSYYKTYNIFRAFCVETY